MKQKCINILTKYKYMIMDDICEKVTNSRLYNYDCKEGWIGSASSSNNVQSECSTSATRNPNELNRIITEDVSEEASFTNSPPDSEDAVSSIVASLNKETMKLPTIEAMLHYLCPRKLKRTVDNDWAWDNIGVKSRKKRHVNKEAKSLETILQVISNKDPSFAANILTRITTNNPPLQSVAASNDNTHMLGVCKK